MTNPLRIFSNTQIDALNQENLLQFKKEILLEFQLTSDPTIRINNEEIDKNGVLEIFKELEHKLPLYLFIRQNKTLNTFLYLGNIAILNDDKIIQKIKNNDNLKHEIEQKLVDKLQPLIADLVIKPNQNHVLKLIKQFIDKLNPTLNDKVYSKTYNELKSHIDNLNEKYTTPFSDAYSTNFHPDIGKYVSSNFYHNLISLPDAFNSIRIDYAIWCNNNIVFEALKRENQFDNYSKESLSIIGNAARIASNVHDKKRNLDIASTIQKYLEQKRKFGNSDGGSNSVWSILFIIFIIIKIIVFLSR